jgi:hypothetical protein
LLISAIEAANCHVAKKGVLRMKLLFKTFTIFLALTFLMNISAGATEIDYPQVIKTRYEAADQKAGGNFVIWSEREKISYGLDPKLYPGARFVEVTQVTPSVGSITLTYVEVRTVASAVSDYLYLTGNVRFRISGMMLKSSNFPSGTGMSP